MDKLVCDFQQELFIQIAERTTCLTQAQVDAIKHDATIVAVCFVIGMGVLAYALLTSAYYGYMYHKAQRTIEAMAMTQ